MNLGKKLTEAESREITKYVLSRFVMPTRHDEAAAVELFAVLILLRNFKIFDDEACRDLLKYARMQYVQVKSLE